MTSSRGLRLNLTACEDTLETVRLDNHVCISADYANNASPFIIKFKKNNWLKMFSKTSDVVLYPVMFTSDVKKEQIYLPPEIAADLAAKTGQKIEIILDNILQDEWVNINKVSFIIQNIRNGKLRDGSIDVKALTESIRDAMSAFGNSFPLHIGQVLQIPYHNVLLELRVASLVPGSFGVRPGKNSYFRLSESSVISVTNECQKLAVLTGVPAKDERELSEIPLDFAAMGVGGYQKEIANILEAVGDRLKYPKSVLDGYGDEESAEGVLLYGPPGTGKTLLAKTVSKIISKEPPIIIAGPELKDTYYGGTQQNLGDLFEKARNEPDKRFVYIFDEIDSLFAVRGSGDSVSASNNNDLVSRFLSIMGGIETLNNITIIGTTNRKELIDPAILRAGRMDTQIYIGLPGEKDRLDILRRHTSKMQKTLGADVNLAEIARLTKNYSGAELARVVKVARTHAKEINLDAASGMMKMRADIKTIEQCEKVSQKYFLQALKEVRPMFGIDDAALFGKQEQFVLYDDQLVDIAGNFQQSLNCLRKSKEIQQLNFLICGQAGTGKTSLANYLASRSGFPHVQVLSASRLLPEHFARQIEIIDEVFARARQSSEPSVILLENIEDLLESSPDYAIYNNKLRLKFNELLKDAGGLNSKLLVLATTRNQKFLSDIGMAQTFAESAVLGGVRLEATAKVRCGERFALIAASLGMKLENDLSAKEYLFDIDIPIKDLIYQLHKFAAKFTPDSKLMMSEFIDALPQKFKQVRRDEVTAAPKNAVNFFRP